MIGPAPEPQGLDPPLLRQVETQGRREVPDRRVGPLLGDPGPAPADVKFGAGDLIAPVEVNGPAVIPNRFVPLLDAVVGIAPILVAERRIGLTEPNCSIEVRDRQSKPP